MRASFGWLSIIEVLEHKTDSLESLSEIIYRGEEEFLRRAYAGGWVRKTEVT